MLLEEQSVQLTSWQHGLVWALVSRSFPHYVHRLLQYKIGGQTLIYTPLTLRYIFRKIPCIHTRYIFSCRFLLTMSRRSTPSCSIANSG